MKTLVPMYLTVQMHFICISETFKNALKSTDLIVRLKAVKELKSTMFSGRKFHIYTTRFTKNAAITFVLPLCLHNLCI